MTVGLVNRCFWLVYQVARSILEPSQMHQGHEKANAGSGPGKEPAKEEERQVAPADTENVLPLLLDVVGIIIFGGLAGAFFSTGHPLCGIWLTFLSIVCGFLTVAHHFYPRYKRRTLCGFTLIVLPLAVGFSYWSYCILHPDR